MIFPWMGSEIVVDVIHGCVERFFGRHLAGDCLCDSNV
jgi:hypothetical protein